jgi:hypothetical protein
MTGRKDLWLRAVLVLALMFVVALTLVPTAQAGKIIEGDTIPVGEVIGDDVIITGDNVVVDGSVEGDLLAIANTVTINGSVDGSLVAFGGTLTINGQVGGSVYIVGGNLELGPEAVLSSNLHFLGLNVDVEAGSRVERDLVAASLGAMFAGEVGRDLRAIIGPGQLIGLILDAVNWQTGQFQAPSVPTPEPGSQSSDVGQLGTALASVNPVSSISYVALGSEPQDQPQVSGMADSLAERDGPDAEVEPTSLEKRGEDLVLNFVSLLVVGALVVWLLPSLLERWSENVRARPLPAVGLGLVAYIVGFAGAGLLAVLIFASGIWLLIISLGKLALVFWGVGYASLFLAFFIFVLFVSFVSKVIVAYLAGRLILNRLAPSAVQYRIISLLLGLFIYVLLRSIPILGWVIGVVVTLLGLGAVWLVYRDSPLLKLQAVGNSKELQAPVETEE